MNRRLLARLASRLILAGLTCNCLAQNVTTSVSAPTNQATAPKCSRVDADDEVYVVHCAETAAAAPNHQIINTSNRARLGESVTVTIHGLSRWAKNHDSTELRLYLAGQKLSSVTPALIFPDQDYVNFTLRPTLTDQNERKKWIDIVNEARGHQDGEILMSVGPNSNMQPFPSSVGLSLTVYPWYTRGIEALLVVLLVALLVLAWRTELLRDTTRGIPVPPSRAPLSLGRVQMAWWFYVVIASYLYIWLITGETNTLSASVLALIGISAATGLSAIFVDQQKISNEQTQLNQLRGERTALDARIAQLGSNPSSGTLEAAELQAKTARLAEVTSQLAKLPTTTTIPVSRGLLDIFSDGGGVSFHRFQMVIWTIVLGIVFIKNVNRDLTMPEFDTTLLGLMGLSAGTYIGFKFPEATKS
jgi:type II secretory pathway pseudopilin PulG